MAQALKAVKGVLNKLTPEKFERLLQQLLDAVKSVEVLRGLITLVFENAVAQVRPSCVSHLQKKRVLECCCAMAHGHASGCSQEPRSGGFSFLLTS